MCGGYPRSKSCYAHEELVTPRVGSREPHSRPGHLALAALPESAVVECKTHSDLISCMASARDRFEHELARSRYLGGFVVVVEGDFQDVLAARRQMSESSLIGTLAAWQRRYTGFFFAGTVELAARFAFRFVAGQVVEIERASGNLLRAHDDGIRGLRTNHAREACKDN